MAANPKKGTEAAMIDCCMIVVTTEEDNPRSIAVTSDTAIAVEAQYDTREAVRLVIKDILKAQKPERRIPVGHTITLTDNLTILEMIEILQGGTITRGEGGKITGYTPPPIGEKYMPVKFKLDVYTSQIDEGGNTVQYEKISYPGCQGSPVALGAEDNVFRVNTYTINSAPKNGEAPYTLEYVDELPTVDEAVLGALTVTSKAGSTTGKTVLTVSPSKGSGNSYKYKTGASVTAPVYDEVCSSGYTDWDGSAEITATTGQKILVVEVDSANKAKAAGTATVAAKA